MKGWLGCLFFCLAMALPGFAEPSKSMPLPPLMFSGTPPATPCTHPVGKHCVDLFWSASTSPGVTYNIFRSTTANACVTGTKISTTPVSSLNFVDSNPTNGATYFYALNAQLGGDTSICTSDVQVLIPPPGAPGDPGANVQ